MKKSLLGYKKASITLGALITSVITVLYYLFGGGTVVLPVIIEPEPIAVEKSIENIDPALKALD